MSARNGEPCIACGANEWGNDRKCKACMRKRASEWYWKNRDRAIKTRLEYQREHHADMLGRCQAYRKRHPERKKESEKKWNSSNPDKLKESCRRRRARRLGADGEYSHKQFREMCVLYGNVCLCCGASGVPLAADHVVPLTKGGSNGIENIQPLCRSCNSKKSNRHSTDYRPFAITDWGMGSTLLPVAATKLVVSQLTLI